MRFVLIGLTLISSSVFGSTYPFPVLQMTLGGMDKQDGIRIAKSCEIYDDHSGIKLKEVLELAAKAEQEKISTAMHIVREIPSVEIWVNYPTRKALGPSATGIGARKILLLEDSSAMRFRNDQASESLRDLVRRLCKNL